MSEEMKPCPFCGSTRVHIAGAGATGVPGVSWTFCDGCFSQGGICDTVEEAVELWNRRAERTCRMELLWTDGEDGECYECSECGDIAFTHCDAPEYCPNCGAKVVDE